MTDLVDQLHVLAREYWQHRPHYEAAAAEIERLQAVIADQPRDMQIADRLIKDLQADNERLTAERAQLVLMTEVQRASNREIERLQATTVPASLHLYEITKLELEIKRLQALNTKLRTRVELADK